jgi:hypothetical protein
MFKYWIIFSQSNKTDKKIKIMHDFKLVKICSMEIDLISFGDGYVNQ